MFNAVKYCLHLSQTNLDETNFLGIAPEALPTTHETILPDNSMRISTDSAATQKTNVLEIISSKKTKNKKNKYKEAML